MRCASFIKQGHGQNTSKQVRHGLDTARNKGKSTIQGQETRQNKLNSDLENTKWLSKAANSWRVLYAEQYSAMTERKSKAYKACVIV